TLRDGAQALCTRCHLRYLVFHRDRRSGRVATAMLGPTQSLSVDLSLLRVWLLGMRSALPKLLANQDTTTDSKHGDGDPHRGVPARCNPSVQIASPTAAGTAATTPTM